MTIDSKTAGAKRYAKAAIDNVLATLYANDARGYLGGDAKVFKSEALKRIQSQLSTLDRTARTDIEDETKYRIEGFEEFSHLPESVRREVLRIAKEKAITIEEAYKRKVKR
jgi:hypothetical protein